MPQLSNNSDSDYDPENWDTFVFEPEDINDGAEDPSPE